ncbi:hypothetical protein [Loktanella sp. R86503]|uniref:phage adaptor protein n=1 Tax=Loktanella sp. R86503 TaxID=3093847 RepID=UPI0036DBDC19
MTTNSDICTAALRKIGVVSASQPIQAEDLRDALAALGRMLAAWQNHRYNLWTYAEATIPLTGAASYIMDPAPVEVHDVRFRRNGLDMPMQQITREEYNALPQKASIGIPSSYFVNRQATGTTLTVWPVLASGVGESLEVTYTRAIVTPLAGDAMDFPAQFEDAVVYGLAARLADDYEVAADRIIMRAEAELDLALSFDREGSVYFAGDEYR